MTHQLQCLDFLLLHGLDPFFLFRLRINYEVMSLYMLQDLLDWDRRTKADIHVSIQQFGVAATGRYSVSTLFGDNGLGFLVGFV
jgi:hypothetical protein